MNIGKVRIRNWVAFALWVALIFAISSIPAAPLIKIQNQPQSVILRFLFSDPVGHVVMFGILGILLGRSTQKSFSLVGRGNLILWVFLLSFVLALAIEAYQQLIVLGRSFEVEDIVWDFVGIGVAVAYLCVVCPRVVRKGRSVS